MPLTTPKKESRKTEEWSSLSCQDASGPDIFSMFKKEGREGTKIEIPANSLVDSLGMAPDGPIEILLQEYYSKSDIILANLHTMSDTMLLETAGMINIQAWSDGKKLQLHEGSEMFLEYSADNIPEGMQIFLGEEGDDQVYWVPQGGDKIVSTQGECL